MFQIGEKVSLLNDTGTVLIIDIISDYTAVVLDENGFEQKFPLNQLVKIKGDLSKVDFDADLANRMAKQSERKKSISPKRKKKDGIEIDLHIENLVENHSEMGNWEIIQLQLSHFEKAMNKAILKKEKKLVVIHGVGNGVLKKEIRYTLNKYENCIAHDASYQKYGAGATEIIFN